MVGRQGRSPVFVADDIGFESYVTDHFYGGMSHGVTADCKSAAFTHSWFDSSPVDHFKSAFAFVVMRKYFAVPWQRRRFDSCRAYHFVTTYIRPLIKLWPSNRKCG